MKDRLFFFWSQEWRKISRAPASVVAQVPDPAWLDDPQGRELRGPGLARPERGEAPGRLAGAEPRPDRLPGHAAERAGHAPGGASRGLADRTRAGASWPATPTTPARPPSPAASSSTPRSPTSPPRRPSVPGQVGVAQLTTTISPAHAERARLPVLGQRDQVRPTARTCATPASSSGSPSPSSSPRTASGLIPQVAITGLSSLGSTQLFDNKYRNYTVADSLSLPARQPHLEGRLPRWPSSRRTRSAPASPRAASPSPPGAASPPSRTSCAATADGACGAACSYSEVEREIDSQLRFARYEVYVQDSWKVQAGSHPRPRPALRGGAGGHRRERPAHQLRPLAVRPGPRRPTFANAAGTTLVVGTGDPTNGIVVAGENSPHGRAIYGTDKNNLQPRLGLSWDVRNDGRMVVRGGFGIYYDQPLVGIFLQNAAVNPPLVSQPFVLNAAALQSRRGPGRHDHGAPFGLIGDLAIPSQSPRTLQWNAGRAAPALSAGRDRRRLRGLGGRRPDPARRHQPAAARRTWWPLGSVNRARPYPGYGSITLRQTTARARYHGLLVGFRHEGGRAGTLNLAYTLSQSKTDATNDRDAVDLPQNPHEPRRRVRAGPHRPHPRVHRQLRLRAAVLQERARPARRRPSGAGRSRASRSSGRARRSRGS